MEDKPMNGKDESAAVKTAISAREHWRNLWNALSEEALAEDDVVNPEAEQVKRTLLRRLVLDARAQVIPADISALEENQQELPADDTGNRAPTTRTDSTSKDEPEQPTTFQVRCLNCRRITTHGLKETTVESGIGPQGPAPQVNRYVVCQYCGTPSCILGEFLPTTNADTTPNE